VTDLIPCSVRLIVSGGRPLLPLYALTTRTGTTLPVYVSYFPHLLYDFRDGEYR